MKKLVLFIIAVTAFVGVSVAQEVWSSGYYTDSDGKQQGAVYKNNDKVFDVPYVDDNYGSCPALDVFQGDVYWAKNCYNSDGTFNNTKIMKNADNYSVGYLGAGAHIYDMSREGPNNVLFAVGCKNVAGVKTAARWRNNEQSVIGLMGDGYYPSEAYSFTGYISEGTFWVYSVGYQYTSATEYHGVIWKGNAVLSAFDDGTKLYGIALYEGYFYTVGVQDEEGVLKLKVWSTNAETGSTSYMYTLAENLNPTYTDERFSIFIDDAGDIYVNGMLDGHDKIWKNMAEIYTTEYYFTSVVANPDGVYYSGSSMGDGSIWKDGARIYQPTGCNRVTKLFVPEPECTNEVARTLPYFEGFETGETDWTCWEVEDVDGNNANNASYWHRCGEDYTAATGSYCAWHSYGPEGVAQEGWLVSPLIAIPETGEIKLSFKTLEANVDGYYEYEGVWILEGENKTEVWSQPAVLATEDWKLVEVDLSAFRGREIQVGFKYKGRFAHTWFIDDVNIKLNDGPTPASYTISVVSADPAMGSATGGGTFVEGTEIQISAIANAGYFFTSWSDGNADNPRTVTVTQNARYVAQFSSNSAQTYTLTVMCNASEGTTLGSGTYIAGSTVTIAAIPNSGFEFDKWNDENTQNPRNVTVNEDMAFTAIFKSTGLGENGGRLVALYPNPANSFIRIEGLEAESQVKIYNAMGVLVKVVNTNADEEIAIGDLASGFYIVRCGNATLRFVKE